MEQNRVRVDLPPAPWRMHEFFAGSGLVAYGLRGMFRPVWANDISPQKAAVYAANFPSGHFRLADIRDIRGRELPPAHLSWASFPCQDLSLAGSMGGIYAPRSGLVWEWLRVLDELDTPPQILLLENVSGFLSSSHGANYRALHAALVEREYDCGAFVLNASYFVPQSRPRVFVLAARRGLPLPGGLTCDAPNWLHNRAAADLGNSLPRWIWWNAEKPPRRRVKLADILEQNAPFDRDDVLKLIPERHWTKLFQSRSACATGYRRTRQGRQQLELRFDGVAGCLRTPQGGSSKQYLVTQNHGEAHARLLTVREAARLMGAPDSFVLPGSDNDAYRAMGDAVAVPVTRFLGEQFLSKLAEAFYAES